MEAFWTKSYPKNLDVNINADQYANLVEFAEHAISQFGEKVAYSNLGTGLLYKELDRISSQLAAHMQNKLGIKKGDKVALMMPNLLQYPVAVIAALRLGAIVVNINPLYTARELEHILRDSEAKCVIILENFANTLEQVLTKVPVKSVIITRIGDMFPFPKRALVNTVVKYIKKMVPAYSIPHIAWTEAAHTTDASLLKKPTIVSEDLAFLQYTGGTTGASKGAMLTHRNIIANTLQILSWLKAFPEIKLTKAICPLPLYHIFALLADCFAFFTLGTESILITNPRDMKSFMKDLKKGPFSAIIGVNTLFKHLLLQDEFKKLDFTQLKLTLGGGMAVEKIVAQEWKKTTGCTLVEAYGLTEASPAVCINPPNIGQFEGSVGLPLPSTMISIRDENDKELGIDQEGELLVQGPQVFKGYWKNPEETKTVLSQDGWLKTGDIAKITPEGFVHIMDRKKDIIIVSGFNVYPNEIEDVVTHHEKVLEACAVSIPDERTGEAVKLFVVKKDQSLTETELLSYCRKNLVNYKIPRVIEWRKELPKSNVGKILRKDLKLAKDPV
jgi:long-chain acyl-CoA synthetase